MLLLWLFGGVYVYVVIIFDSLTAGKRNLWAWAAQPPDSSASHASFI